jgi:hypothetical protein
MVPAVGTDAPMSGLYEHLRASGVEELLSVDGATVQVLGLTATVRPDGALELPDLVEIEALAVLAADPITARATEILGTAAGRWTADASESCSEAAQRLAREIRASLRPRNLLGEWNFPGP